MPDFESVRPDHAIGAGCKLMSAGMEVTVHERVSREEILGLLGRFESLHLPLSSSRRSMRVLSPIVRIAALSMLDAGKQLTLNDAIAPQLGNRPACHAFYCGTVRS